MKNILFAASVFGLSATSAFASSVTFDFTEEWNGSSHDYASVLSFEQGGITLDVSAALYYEPQNVGDALQEYGDLNVSRYEDYGLYVTYWGDNNHRIDGFYNELVKFQFDQEVEVHEITFGSILDSSVFDLFIDDNGNLIYQGSDDVEASVSFDFSTTLFGVGASENGYKIVENCYNQPQYSFKKVYVGHDWKGNKKYKWKKTQTGTKQVCKHEKEKYYSGFKITSVTVKHPEIVPLPAAGWMLLAGVGGLVALRRRRKTF